MAEMPHGELRNAANAIVARLQSDFDPPLSKLATHHAEAIDEARRAALTQATEEWAAKVETEREESQRRLDAALSEARAEGERRVEAETARVRAEVEQASAHGADRMREEM